MRLLCLDLEGVLAPEFWMELALATNIPALGQTTRDIPDYVELMQMRQHTLDQHGLSFSKLQDAIDAVEPLPGAKEFLDWSRQYYQVVILSDTFYEFAMPLMKKLNHPLLLCHRLVIKNDRIVGYKRRQSEPKVKAMKAFQSLELQTVAAGDSYNDVGMLQEADRGYFFNPPDHVRKDFPKIPCVANYEELKQQLMHILEQ